LVSYSKYDKNSIKIKRTSILISILTEKNLKDFINILIDYKNNPINHGNKISSDDDLINIVKAKRKK